jgi:hypothetical protein
MTVTMMTMMMMMMMTMMMLLLLVKELHLTCVPTRSLRPSSDSCADRTPLSTGINPSGPLLPRSSTSLRHYGILVNMALRNSGQPGSPFFPSRHQLIKVSTEMAFGTASLCCNHAQTSFGVTLSEPLRRIRPRPTYLWSRPESLVRSGIQILLERVRARVSCLPHSPSP